MKQKKKKKRKTSEAVPGHDHSNYGALLEDNETLTSTYYSSKAAAAIFQSGANTGSLSFKKTRIESVS